MATCLLYRLAETNPARFYRIELAMNLFDEVSLLREWGIKGGKGCSTINIFGNLREASVAADRHRNRMLKRGYDRA
ncbi:WGR domain-containing protein [Phaeobacter sp. HF9A]|uniref:WGR domain-containing protein n=1 Tax=Phaeobacter sp. HF9A TaxID=2721561 RepID=UPI0014300CE2|nr:WGR domain-containing protein [Phaeobacter sp. HF9A]NIZ14194.1 WGR domain-containing protein [Phaeobacter sp. HF9A]